MTLISSIGRLRETETEEGKLGLPGLTQTVIEIPADRTNADAKRIYMDATISESHDKEIEVTDNPIEFGASVSDHAIILPRRLALQARITNSPTKFKEDDELSVAYRIRQQHSSVAGDDAAINKVQTAWEFLNSVADNRKIINVTTNLQEYENFVLISLTTNQDWKTSQVLDFTAEFREVFIVETFGTVEARYEEGATKEQAIPEESIGEIQPNPITIGISAFVNALEKIGIPVQ